MRCAACGRTNEESASFCGGCGVPLAEAVKCRSCGSLSAGSARYCSDCGEALGEHAPTSARTLPAAPRPLPSHIAAQLRAARSRVRGERKQVSVLFADVKGSMDMSEGLDSERWWTIMDRFCELLGEGVHRFEGIVLRFTGDGMMAVFGAPLAYEDHARRAAHAALYLREAIAAYAQELASAQGLEFSVRMGINSGEVVVGTIGDDLSVEYAAVGRTAGIAERMERLARPGTICVSAGTAKLIGGYFQLAELGTFEIKGSSAPEEAFELIGEGSSRDRLDVAAGALSPFLGREREQALLESALGRALEGDGQVVGLIGEAGVGKSRLARELAERCAAEQVDVRWARAFALSREVPLGLALELWRTMLDIAHAAEPAAARERVERGLTDLDPRFAEELPLVFDFLGVPDPERQVQRMDPEARQRRLLSLTHRLVHALGRLEPRVIVVEDLHWIDAASVVFLNELVDAVANTRTLLVLTYRPEQAPTVPPGRHCAQLDLVPLPQDAAGMLLASLLGRDESLDGLIEVISARALGNPFFCEELVAALAESGHLIGKPGAYRLGRTLEEVVLPTTVQATLASRLDRLGERESELVHVAAVIGHELSGPLLREISGFSEGELEDGLRTLVSGELFHERRGAFGIEYGFRHPLTQEVAYRSQLSDRRRQIHRRTAIGIEHLHPDRLDELAALVAHHFEQADESIESARRYARAATWLGLSDISQALAHWRKVAELVENLPDWRKDGEVVAAAPGLETGLALMAHIRQLDLGWRLGVSEAEAEAHYRAGRELALRTGDRFGLLGITEVYASVCSVSGQRERFSELAEEGDRLSLELETPALRIAASLVTIHAREVLGRTEEALALAEDMAELGAKDPRLGSGLGVACPYVVCLAFKASILSHVGRLEEAQATFDTAVRVAREQGDLEGEGFAHGGYIPLARYTGATETTMEHALQCHEIAERVGSSFSRAMAIGYLGTAHLMAGQIGDAVTALERAIELSRTAGTARENEAFWQVGLSEARIQLGEPARALEAATSAVELARAWGTKLVLPACHRAHAEALLSSEEPDRVAAAERALDAATVAVEETGVRAELPFIERARGRLTAIPS